MEKDNLQTPPNDTSSSQENQELDVTTLQSQPSDAKEKSGKYVKTLPYVLVLIILVTLGILGVGVFYSYQQKQRATVATPTPKLTDPHSIESESTPVITENHAEKGKTAKVPFDTVPEEVLTAARRDMRKMLNLIPQGDFESYGFNSMDEVARAQLGKGYLLYQVSDMEQYKALDEKSFKGPALTYFVPSDSWHFAITVDNKPRVDMIVGTVENRLEGGSIGGFVTTYLYELEKKLPDILSDKGLSSTYELRFVRIHPGYFDFALLEVDGEEYIAVLEDPSNERYESWYGLKVGTLYPAAEVILIHTENLR